MTGWLHSLPADDGVSPELRQSRALLNQLRSQAQVADVDAAEAPMQVNDILLTSGEDKQLSGVVRIADLTETDQTALQNGNTLPPASMPGVVSSGEFRSFANDCAKPQKKMKRSRGAFAYKTRERIRSVQDGVTKVTGGLIEFRDTDVEEYFDTYDYTMPILLVAGSEPAENEPEDSTPAADDAGRPEILNRRLSDIKPTLSYAWGEKPDLLPKDFFKRMDEGVYEPIVADRTVMQWAPTNLWYYPLYFQDVGLERYGHTRHPLVQPFASTGRFLGQVAGLPYQMVLHPPTCPEYALGYYQPGEWAPKKKYQIPFNEEAATVELVWIAGLILLMP